MTLPHQERENPSVRRKSNGRDPSQSEYAKYKEVNNRGNFPALKEKGLKIIYTIETVMNLVNTFRHSSIHFYPCNLGLLNVFRKGTGFCKPFF